jgi:hypothetical protein
MRQQELIVSKIEENFEVVPVRRRVRCSTMTAKVCQQNSVRHPGQQRSDTRENSDAKLDLPWSKVLWSDYSG